MTEDEKTDTGTPYADAVRELEQILDELDRDEIDIDDLARQVRRAAHLIRICRTRIEGARMEVEEIVVDLAPREQIDEPEAD